MHCAVHHSFMHRHPPTGAANNERHEAALHNNTRCLSDRACANRAHRRNTPCPVFARRPCSFSPSETAVRHCTRVWYLWTAAHLAHTCPPCMLLGYTQKRPCKDPVTPSVPAGGRSTQDVCACNADSSKVLVCHAAAAPACTNARAPSTAALTWQRRLPPALAETGPLQRPRAQTAAGLRLFRPRR